VARLYAGASVQQDLLTKKLPSSQITNTGGHCGSRPLHTGVSGKALNILTSQPRHYVELGLTFPFATLWSIKPSHKWGSLPRPSIFSTTNIQSA
jgi:hypothetical protein